MNVTASHNSFSKKNGPIMPLDCTKQWIVLGASAFQSMRAGFLCPKYDNFACLHTRQDQNELYLKKYFFFYFYCKSIADPFSEAYTQPYSFGGRIKLIICQIRHELSVTIHKISNIWKKKTLDGGPYIIQYNLECYLFLF